MSFPRSPKQLATMLSNCLRSEFVTGAVRAGDEGYGVAPPIYGSVKRQYYVQVTLWVPDAQAPGSSRVLWRARLIIDSKMNVATHFVNQNSMSDADVKRLATVVSHCEASA